MSSPEEIAAVYHSDINRAVKTVWNRPDGYLHFLSGLNGCRIRTLLSKEWMEALSKICATDNMVKVGRLPSRESGRDEVGKGTI